MKKLITLGVAAVALVTSVFAGGGRGGAAYFIATQDCTPVADGSIKCVAKADPSGISVLVILILVGVGIWLWQRKNR